MDEIMEPAERLVEQICKEFAVLQGFATWPCGRAEESTVYPAVHSQTTVCRDMQNLCNIQGICYLAAGMATHFLDCPTTLCRLALADTPQLIG